MQSTIRDHYDFIIAGAGCAGLSLVSRMILSGKFRQKKILIADRKPKNTNDRTWCFWEQGEGFFEQIVHSSWEKLWFHSDSFSKCYAIGPYKYKMVRGIDFYEYCNRLILSCDYVHLTYGEISSIQSDANGTSILLDEKKITAGTLFNSIPPAYDKSKGHHLLQHFKGWVIETEAPVFQKEEATLMDFRVHQSHGTSFVYVMPFSAQSALVEYTLFTGSLLKQEQYSDELSHYLNTNFPGLRYRVVEEEFGVIPMTSHRFQRRTGNIINIGTAGGQTKASTGYTFQFIQKHTAALVDAFAAGASPIDIPDVSRFHYYDRVLLNVLATGKLDGRTLFSTMFRKNPISRIFRFLDNESTLVDDLQIISSLPFSPFLKAGMQEIVKKS